MYKYIQYAYIIHKCTIYMNIFIAYIHTQIHTYVCVYVYYVCTFVLHIYAFSSTHIHSRLNIDIKPRSSSVLGPRSCYCSGVLFR